MSTFTVLVSGLGGAIGCDLRRAQNQLLFVEYNGKLSRLNLFRTGTIVSSGTGVLHGTWHFDFDTGAQVSGGPGADVWWEQMTAVLRQLVPQNGAALVNLGPVDFASITPDTLSSLTYSTTPIDGNNDPSNKLTTNDVFAVRTSSGNYAKVKVVAYGYDLQLHWVTYHLDAPYQVLGTGYTNPEDVKASADGAHAYVTERNGDLVRVALANANRPMATVVASGMTAPQQMFLDEAHHARLRRRVRGRGTPLANRPDERNESRSPLESRERRWRCPHVRSPERVHKRAGSRRRARQPLRPRDRHKVHARHGANCAILPHVVRRRRDVPACGRARPGESHHRDRRRCRELACRRERLARTPFERGHAHPGANPRLQ